MFNWRISPCRWRSQITTRWCSPDASDFYLPDLWRWDSFAGKMSFNLTISSSLTIQVNTAIAQLLEVESIKNEVRSLIVSFGFNVRGSFIGCGDGRLVGGGYGEIGTEHAEGEHTQLYLCICFCILINIDPFCSTDRLWNSERVVARGLRRSSALYVSLWGHALDGEGGMQMRLTDWLFVSLLNTVLCVQILEYYRVTPEDYRIEEEVVADRGDESDASDVEA